MTSIAKTMTASVFALAACLAAPAAAQDGGGTDEAVARSDTSYGIEEIIVTANKREASLQDPPLAIPAIGGGSLETRGRDDVPDLTSSVPNLRANRQTAV